MSNKEDAEELTLIQSRIDSAMRELSRIPSSGGFSGGFWARITGVTSVADNRWKYDWTQVDWIMSAGVLSYSVPTDAMTGPQTITGIGSTGFAWNSLEMDNTDAVAGSGWEDLTLTQEDSGTIDFDAVNPIGTANDGHEKFPLVYLRPVQLKDSNHLAYVFSGWNTPIMSAMPGEDDGCPDFAGGSYAFPTLNSPLGTTVSDTEAAGPIIDDTAGELCEYLIEVHIEGVINSLGANAGGVENFRVTVATTNSPGSTVFQYQNMGGGTFTISEDESFTEFGPGPFNPEIFIGMEMTFAAAAGSSMQATYTWTVTHVP